MGAGEALGLRGVSTTGALVLARFDSRRLPGKALAPLGDRPLLAHVLARVAAARSPQLLVLATSDREVDSPITTLGGLLGVPVFRGQADDVLRRCIECADAFGLSHVVRISGDSPFIDPVLIDRAVAANDAGGAEMVTNVFPRSFPPGDSVEVVATETLRRVLGETTDAEDREHVTRFIYAHPDRFSIVNLAAPAGLYAGVNLTVDTPADLAMARWIVARYDGPPETMAFDRIVEIARAWQADQEEAARA